MRGGAAAVAVFTLGIATLGGQSPTPVFRVGAESVALTVAITRGNSAVSGLTAADFRLYDNDVLQHVAAVSQDAVPLDVSFVVDLNVGVPQALDPREAVQLMVSFLRASDRFRVLTMGQAVVNAVPWQFAGPSDTSRMQYVLGHVRYVADSVLAALMHRADLERRHLIVALTPAEDLCSLTSAEKLLRVAERSGATFHWINTPTGAPSRAWSTRSDGVEYTCRNAPSTPIDLGRVLSDVTKLTGGSVHTARSQSDVNKSALVFERILDDFRRSYILHYEPEGVARSGWHRLRVELPGSKDYSVRTRPGYWGAETGPSLR